MGIERLQACVNSSAQERLRVIYGLAVEDTFISPALHEWNIEKALQKSLSESGFGQVVFIAPHRPPYSVGSDGSIIPVACQISQPMQANNYHLERSMRKLSGGPFEDLVLMDAGSQSKRQAYETMGDVHSIRLLDSLMKDKKPEKTATVFMQAEAMLGHFEDRRTLAGIIGEWLRLPSSNKNCCFFLFSAVDYDELCRAAEMVPVPELRSLIFRQRNHRDCGGGIYAVNGPDVCELECMVRSLRDRHGVDMDDECAACLPEWMSIEGGSLKLWMNRLYLIQPCTLSSVRKSGWFSGISTSQMGAIERLDMLVGLDEIKQRIRELRAWLKYRNEMAENSDLSQTDSPLHHLVFSGNPGTGKTTIARLVGEIYRELGILRRGHLIEVKGSDLVAEHVGGTAIKTNLAIDRAIDGILFIDEAYMLAEEARGGFGREALDTLLTRMEDDRFRLVVIIAGYPEKIRRLLDSNPGLPRRFPRENLIEFDDYKPHELWLILQQFLSKRQIPFERNMEQLLVEIIEALYRERDEYFGNAGEMRNLADALERVRAARLQKMDLPLSTPLVAEDLPQKYRVYSGNFTDEEEKWIDLDRIIGWQSLKTYIRSLAFLTEIHENRVIGISANRPFHGVKSGHLIFEGATGTGKTTAARMMADLLHAEGILPSKKVVECSWIDLIYRPYTGSQWKIEQKAKEALGGILLIDDIFPDLTAPVPGMIGETLMLLAKLLDLYSEKLILIVTGSSVNLAELFTQHPALQLRFEGCIRFENFTHEELTAIFQQKAADYGIAVPDEVRESVQQYFNNKLAGLRIPSGNAYEALHLFNLMKTRMAERLYSWNSRNDTRGTNIESHSFHPEDIPDDPNREDNQQPLLLSAWTAGEYILDEKGRLI